MSDDGRGRGRPKIGEQTAFTLPDAWLGAIDDLAGRNGSTRSALLRLAVREYLARHVEDLDPGLAAILGDADPQEVASLTWEDVDLEKGLIRLRSADSKGQRHSAPLPPEVAHAIAQSRAAGAGGSVFPNAAGPRRPLEGDR